MSPQHRNKGAITAWERMTKNPWQLLLVGVLLLSPVLTNLTFNLSPFLDSVKETGVASESSLFNWSTPKQREQQVEAASDPMQTILLKSQFGDMLRTLQQTTIRYYVYDDEAIDQPGTHVDNTTAISRNNLAPDAETDMLIINSLKNYNNATALPIRELRTYNPEEADLFIVPLSIVAIAAKSLNGESVPQGTLLYNAFTALQNSKWFQRNHGNDHVMISTWYGRWEQRMYSYHGRVDPLDSYYSIVWNVTLAAGKDRGGIQKLFEQQDKNLDFQEWFRWERLHMTRATFSLGNIPVPSMPLIEPTYERFQSSKYSFFYHIRPSKFHTPHSTEFRRLPLREDVLAGLNSSTFPATIGNDLEKETWMEHFTSSRFCLVLRGDDPKSHSLLRSVKVGCIPVVISDAYPDYAPTLKSSIDMQDYCIFIAEELFWENPLNELKKLEQLDEAYIRKKLLGLSWAQRILIPDHPHSLFVPAFLREAMEARKKQQPETTLQEYNWHHSDGNVLYRPRNMVRPGTFNKTFYIYGFDHDHPKYPSNFNVSNFGIKFNWMENLSLKKSSLSYYSNYKHSDDMWFLHAARRHPKRTFDPNAADLFYVPTLLNIIPELPCFNLHIPAMNGSVYTEEKCFNTHDEAFIFVDRELERSKYFRRSRGRDHIIVASHWKSLEKSTKIPNIKKCNIINFEGSQPTPEANRISLPAMYVGRACGEADIQTPKAYDFAFIGNLEEGAKTEWKIRQFQMRRNICEWLGHGSNDTTTTTNGTMIDANYSVSRCGRGDQCPALAQAKYGFHIRGDTWGSQRPIDTLLSRTIPLFTDRRQYSILPPIVPWEKLSYLVNASTKESLYASLDSILSRPESEYQEMQTLLTEYLPILDHRQMYQFDAYMTEFSRRLDKTPVKEEPEIIPSCLVADTSRGQALLSQNRTLPFPAINLGMPKIGSTSLYQFFICAGYKASHWKTIEHGHLGLCMRDAKAAGMPILKSCDSWWGGSRWEKKNLQKPNISEDQNVDAILQMDISLDKDKCVFPQIEYLDAIHKEEPNATYFLIFRPSMDWARSLISWNPDNKLTDGKSFGERLLECDLPGLPYGAGNTTEELEQWFCEHVDRVRQFVDDNPSHALVELDLYDSSTNREMMSSLYDTDRKCWGHANQNKDLVEQRRGRN